MFLSRKLNEWSKGEWYRNTAAGESAEAEEVIRVRFEARLESGLIIQRDLTLKAVVPILTPPELNARPRLRLRGSKTPNH
jgi:hypothetical protein